MEPITYTNIVVEGVPFTKVLALEIAHAINEHGTAAIVGEMEVDAAREYLNRMDENAAIKITTTAEGQLSVLFYGLLTNVGVEQEAEYATLTLTAATTSALLDIQPVNRSYQKTSATYGQVMEAGDELTEGSVNPHDILRIKGVRAVQDYMIREVQRVYRLQGVEINDKHIEVIVHQMLKKIRIEDNGDSEFLPGTLVDFLEYEEVNEKLEAEGLRPAIGKQGMLGITKASLATDSFLSAASFQETTKVLTEAAIKGKVDHLIGLKENVIIGKLIPAGTGMKCYSDVELDTGMPEEPEEIEFDEMDDEDQDVLDVAEDSEELETADEADLAVDEDEDTFEDEDSSEDSEE